MKKQDYSSSSRSGDVVVTNNEDIMTGRPFQGLINAISQIQQYSKKAARISRMIF